MLHEEKWISSRGKAGIYCLGTIAPSHNITLARARGMAEWTFSTFIPLPKKGDLKQCTSYRTLLLLSHMQATSFFGSYWQGSEWRPKQKLQTNSRDSDKEGGQETTSRISEYWSTRHASSSSNHSLYMYYLDFTKVFKHNNVDRCRHVNSEQNFENFTTMGRFSEKNAKIAQKISRYCDFRPSWLRNDYKCRNSRPNGSPSFHFTVKSIQSLFPGLYAAHQSHVTPCLLECSK